MRGVRISGLGGVMSLGYLAWTMKRAKHTRGHAVAPKAQVTPKKKTRITKTMVPESRDTEGG